MGLRGSSQYPKRRFWIDRQMAQNDRYAELEARRKPPSDEPDMARGVPMRMEVKCPSCRHQAIVNIFARPGHEPKFQCSKCGDCDPDVRRVAR
jgi:ribosomal protein S27E